MLLSFDAKQKLKLSVTRNKEYLSKYLLEEERVVGAMLDPNKLEPEGDGKYKYTVTSFRVFQLDVLRGNNIGNSFICGADVWHILPSNYHKSELTAKARM